MATEVTKQSKHEAINESIRRLNLSKDSLQSLVSEIGGSESPPDVKTVDEPPKVSLKATLETASEKLDELSTGFNKICTELRELLF